MVLLTFKFFKEMRDREEERDDSLCALQFQHRLKAERLEVAAKECAEWKKRHEEVTQSLDSLKKEMESLLESKVCESEILF